MFKVGERKPGAWSNNYVQQWCQLMEHLGISNGTLYCIQLSFSISVTNSIQQ